MGFIFNFSTTSFMVNASRKSLKTAGCGTTQGPSTGPFACRNEKNVVSLHRRKQPLSHHSLWISAED